MESLPRPAGPCILLNAPKYTLGLLGYQSTSQQCPPGRCGGASVWPLIVPLKHYICMYGIKHLWTSVGGLLPLLGSSITDGSLTWLFFLIQKVVVKYT